MNEYELDRETLRRVATLVNMPGTKTEILAEGVLSLLAERDKYRKTLEEFADLENWQTYGDRFNVTLDSAVCWSGETTVPRLARAALGESSFGQDVRSFGKAVERVK